MKPKSDILARMKENLIKCEKLKENYKTRLITDKRFSELMDIQIAKANELR